MTDLERPHHILSHLVHDGCGPAPKILGHAKSLLNSVEAGERKARIDSLVDVVLAYCNACDEGDVPKRCKKTQSNDEDEEWYHIYNLPGGKESREVCHAAMIHDRIARLDGDDAYAKMMIEPERVDPSGIEPCPACGFEHVIGLGYEGAGEWMECLACDYPGPIATENHPYGTPVELWNMAARFKAEKPE